MKYMDELRVFVAGAAYRVDIGVIEFEALLKSSDEFIRLPCLLDGRPCFVVKVRPSQIPYYYVVERKSHAVSNTPDTPSPPSVQN